MPTSKTVKQTESAKQRKKGRWGSTTNTTDRVNANPPRSTGPPTASQTQLLKVHKRLSVVVQQQRASTKVGRAEKATVPAYTNHQIQWLMYCVLDDGYFRGVQLSQTPMVVPVVSETNKALFMAHMVEGFQYGTKKKPPNVMSTVEILEYIHGGEELWMDEFWKRLLAEKKKWQRRRKKRKTPSKASSSSSSSSSSASSSSKSSTSKSLSTDDHFIDDRQFTTNKPVNWGTMMVQIIAAVNDIENQHRVFNLYNQEYIAAKAADAGTNINDSSGVSLKRKLEGSAKLRLKTWNENNPKKKKKDG